MADPRKKLSVNELIDIMNRSKALSVDDSGDTDDVDTLNVESESETINNLEVDQLYDSDDDEEYVPSPHNESYDNDDEEERDAVGSKRKRRMVFTSTPIKGTASTCT